MERGESGIKICAAQVTEVLRDAKARRKSAREIIASWAAFKTNITHMTMWILTVPGLRKLMVDLEIYVGTTIRAYGSLAHTLDGFLSDFRRASSVASIINELVARG